MPSNPPGALFSRSDVKELLNIPVWLLANFADGLRYRYGLAPSVRGGKGRGKRSLYTLADVYKVAVAYRLVIAGLDSDAIGEALKELFPKKKDPMEIAVKQRAGEEAEARYLVVDLSRTSTFFGDMPDGSLGPSPDEWHIKNSLAKRPKFTLRSRRDISEEIRRGTLRAFLAIPFDELLNWVDSRILGREVTFAQPDSSGGKN